MSKRLDEIRERLEKHGGCTNTDLTAVMAVVEAAERFESAVAASKSVSMYDHVKNKGLHPAAKECMAASKALQAAVRAFRGEGEGKK